MNKVGKDDIDFILKTSFELSNQAIYWIDSQGYIVYANSVGCRDLGYTLEEIQEVAVWDLNPEVNTQEKFLEIFNRFAQNDQEDIDERGNIIESVHKTKDGLVFPVEISSKIVTMKDEMYLISYARDISNRVERSERLQLYYEFLDITSDIILLVDRQTQFVEFANKAACEKLGFSVEEFQSMRVSDFRAPLKDNVEIPEIFKKIEEQSYMTTYGIYTTKMGTKFPVETSLSMKDYQGKDYIIAISRDITERVEIEKKTEFLNGKLRDYNKTLEFEVEKAKENLVNYEKVMYHQSKMAAMGEMLENIAHQWRQPLSVISVLATGMKLQSEGKVLNSELLEAGLDDINKNSQFLSRTIDDFSDFFKPNKDEVTFLLQDAIDSALGLCESSMKNFDITVIKNCDNIEITTYQNEFIQVIINLINNAKDALKNVTNKRYIFIRAYQEGTGTVIEVKDNAGGIKEHILPKIFEPYFTTKHKSQGTGIGLYMSNEIISKHMDGEIKVYNETFTYKELKCVGAKFLIYLPLEVVKN